MKVYVHFPIQQLLNAMDARELSNEETSLAALILTVDDSATCLTIQQDIFLKVKKKLKKMRTKHAITPSNNSKIFISFQELHFSLSFFKDDDFKTQIDQSKLLCEQISEDENDLFVKLVLNKGNDVAEDDEDDEDPESIKQGLKSIRNQTKQFPDLFEKKQLRKILEISNRILGSKAITDAANQFVSIFMEVAAISLYNGRIHHMNGRNQEAMKVLEPFVNKAKNLRSSSKDFLMIKINLLDTLGDCYMDDESYAEAVDRYTQAVSLAKNIPSMKMKLNLKRAKAAVMADYSGDAFGNYVSMSGTEGAQYLELAVQKTKAGEKDHSYAVDALSIVHMKRGHIGKALQAILLALLQDNDNIPLRKNLAKLFRDHGDYVRDHVLQMIAAAGESAKGRNFAPGAFLFFGKVLTEHYVFDEGLRFIEESHKLAPSARTSLAKLQANAARSLSVLSSSYYNETLTEVQRNKEWMGKFDPSFATLLRKISTSLVRRNVSFYSADEEVEVNSEGNDVEGLDVFDVSLLICVANMIFLASPLTSPSHDRSKAPHTFKQLGSLVKFCEKILEEKGAEFQAQLARAIPGDLRACVVYKDLIPQILSNRDQVSKSVLENKYQNVGRFYLFGDVGALPLSWGSFSKEDNKVFEFMPLIMPNLQINLLDENDPMFMKGIFNDAIRFLQRDHNNILKDYAPAQKPTIVLSLGNEDCRNGIVRDIQMGKYGSISEAVNARINIVVERAKELSRVSKVRVLVLPVFPVIEPTLQVVQSFNKNLKQKIEKLGEVFEDVSFVSVLKELTQDGGKDLMKDEYLTDTKSVSPAIVEIIGRKLLD
eukprot:maker-scaffold_4-snap-gene-0.8-mRNA-1 protein AED:0.10 eAED:0.10 QI:114/1/1/1/1/1/2/94/823